MGRSPCCDKNGMKKGPWTPEEDEMLINYIKKHGQGTWRTLPKKAGLNRCGKSCRLRWNNYLKPDIKRGMVTEEEELIILELHSVLGNKWSKIAAHLPGRTDNEIKNHWNTKMRRKLLKVGIDPQTHKPVVPDINQILNYSQLISALNPATNLMNILTNILLTQVDPTQFVKLQLFQKLLTKTTAVPGQNNLVPSPGLINNGAASGAGITDFLLTMLKSSEIGQILCGNNNSGFSNATETVSPPNPSANSLGSTTSSSRTEDSVATLCDSKSTPKASINIEQANPTEAPFTAPSAIDIFQNWDELMENESFWKDFTV